MAWIDPQWWEAIAVALGIAYVLLAARESLWCWPCALISTAIFSALFWDVSLLMESALNVYYMVMAVYGWWHWNRDRDDKEILLRVQSWSMRNHLIAGGLILVATLTSGFLLAGHTSAIFPYLDSFTTWASVLTTWMVARKVLENWLYWIVIDAMSIFLYLNRELYLTAVLFLFYVLLAGYGWWYWRRHYLAQSYA